MSSRAAPDASATPADPVGDRLRDEARFTSANGAYHRGVILWSIGGGLAGWGAAKATTHCYATDMANARTRFLDGAQTQFENNAQLGIEANIAKLLPSLRRHFYLQPHATDEIADSVRPLFDAVRRSDRTAVVQARETAERIMAPIMESPGPLMKPKLAVAGTVAACAVVGNFVYHGLHHGLAAKRDQAAKRLQVGEVHGFGERLLAERERPHIPERA